MFSATSKENVATALRALIGVKAETAYEKYTLLEQRDKILRKARQRVSDVQRAAVFVGACPDMCPEKERYEREVQKRVSSYEMAASAGGEYAIDHRRAVKDYGRSAADQEEPLPYELRPASILEMTMNYLLTEIAYSEPVEDAQLPGWYDFLWKRTRAIRKDMTQQMLEGDIALSLLEKCARFHIFCAHRLCELDIGEFDQRMNTENLTKCLQSLKHMYEDMSKRGLTCENEAEFRAYDVLLSLNDTDVLRQILTYDPRVRASNHVRFALKLFSAMQSNNYVAFFRLLRRRATYLQTCLVHRYFNAVRSKAFNTLVRSYGSNSQFQVSNVQRMLGFENEQETIQFAFAFGLTSHPNDAELLVVNRWTQPEEEQQQQSLKRSLVLVESKRNTHLGEILNGGRIAPVCLPSPVISFDEYNCYRGDKLVNDILLAQQNAPPTTATTVSGDDQRYRLFRAAQYAAGGIIESVVGNMLSQSAKSEFGLAKLAERVFLDVVSSSVQLLAKEVTTEQRKAELEKGRRESLRKAAINFREKVTESLLSAGVEAGLREMVQHIKRQERQSQTKTQLLAISRSIQAKLLDSAITNSVHALCSQFYEREIRGPLVRLDRIRVNLSNLLAHRYFHKWKALAYANAQRRLVLNDFPSCPSALEVVVTMPTFDNSLRVEDDVSSGAPPEKRMRTLTGGRVMSAASTRHWSDILTIRHFALNSLISVLDGAVIGSLRVLVMDEMKRQKSTPSLPIVAHDWNKSISNDRIVENAGKSNVEMILQGFPSTPPAMLSINDTVIISSGRRTAQSGMLRSPQQSAYSWMDEIQTYRLPEDDQQTCTGLHYHASHRQSNTILDNSRIPDEYSSTHRLVETEAASMVGQRMEEIEMPSSSSSGGSSVAETLVALHRLRSMVSAEKRVSAMDLDNFHQQEMNASSEDDRRDLS